MPLGEEKRKEKREKGKKGKKEKKKKGEKRKVKEKIRFGIVPRWHLGEAAYLLCRYS